MLDQLTSVRKFVYVTPTVHFQYTIYKGQLNLKSVCTHPPDHWKKHVQLVEYMYPNGTGNMKNSVIVEYYSISYEILQTIGRFVIKILQEKGGVVEVELCQSMHLPQSQAFLL